MRTSARPTLFYLILFDPVLPTKSHLIMKLISTQEIYTPFGSFIEENKCVVMSNSTSTYPGTWEIKKVYVAIVPLYS